MKREDWADYARAFGILSMIAVDLVAFAGAGIALGYLAIHYLGAPTWILIVTSTLGLAVATYQIYLTASRLGESDKSERK